MVINRVSSVCRNLIIINLLVLLAEWVLPRIGIDLVFNFGLHYVGAKSFSWYQFITYMFLHDPKGITHLFFNMYALYMFGQTLEQVWGKNTFLLFYMIAGLLAAVAQQCVWAFGYSEGELFFIGDRLITIGASGAVYGTLVAFGMLFPRSEFFLFFIPYPIKAKWLVIGYGALELLLGIFGSNDGVAHFAHLGGMLAGVLFVLYWKKVSRQRYDWH